MSKSFKTPKGCVIKHVELHAGHADLSMECGGEAGGGRGSFPTPDGGTSNYPKARVSGVRSIHVPGTSITGQGARADFVLIPKHVTCRKTASSTEMNCTVHGADGGTLSGSRKRRR
jgi:hypothetical protein